MFGSALRSDFRPDSDIDLLVEFEPEHTPSLLQMARLERELSALFGGRKIDLRTKEDLSRYFRDAVAASAWLVCSSVRAAEDPAKEVAQSSRKYHLQDEQVARSLLTEGRTRNLHRG